MLACILDCNISDGILSLHEIMHHWHVEKWLVIIFNLISKGIQYVKLGSFTELLSNETFLWRLVQPNHQIFNNYIVCVKINNFLVPYFQSAKWVRQGDPLSSFLFNSIDACLTKRILKAQRNNLVAGMAPNLMHFLWS
jgi:hypothetical protein